VLQALELQDFVLAVSVRLETGAGLTVLTGETGAGKSLLVDALGLLTGARAETGWIRHGAERALVQAEFRGDAPNFATRALVASGRNHARLDGEMVTVGELADVVGARVAVFAQHAHQALLSPAAQREALDRLLDQAGREALASWRDTWQERRDVAAELERLRSKARERLQRADLLDLQMQEIDAAALTAGEEQELEQEASRLRHTDKIAAGVARALARLDADDDGATRALATANRDLGDAARLDARLAPLVAELADALSASQAVATELQAFLDDYAADPQRLDQVEHRLARLQRLFAKYGDGSAAVLDFRDEAARERADIDAGEERIGELESRLHHLDDRLTELAPVVHRARQEAAARLVREASPLLTRLALPAARLEVTLEQVPPGPHGTERVRLDFAADPGEPLAPLSQAASGGELSRVMLALWLVTGSDRPTLVFDEVDAGVGGRAAAAVGELLAELARRHQVLVVTHLAQVAAHADHHAFVGKHEEDGRTVATVAVLDGDHRVRELARMLSGHENDASLAAARDLLTRADSTRPADEAVRTTTAPRRYG